MPPKIIIIRNNKSGDPYVWELYEKNQLIGGAAVGASGYVAILREGHLRNESSILRLAVEGLFIGVEVDVRFHKDVSSTGLDGDPPFSES